MTKAAFVYDAPNLERLERSLSRERMEPYLEMAKQDKVYAIALYQWNTTVSESLYSIIQGFEVTLRNAMHEALCAHAARQDWYEVIRFENEQKKQIEQAKERIAFDKKEVTPGRVVAELMFGFWTALAGTAYAQTLWDKALYLSFREVRSKRKNVAKRLKRIRYLRNRVAHHECVIGRAGKERNLREDIDLILETLAWICPHTSAWVAHNSTFDANYEARPKNPADNPKLKGLEDAHPRGSA